MASPLPIVRAIRRALRQARTAGHEPEAIAMSPALRASLQTASLQYLFTGAADDMLFGVRIELDRSIDGWRIRLTS
jgi:hypothetical protein